MHGRLQCVLRGSAMQARTGAADVVADPRRRTREAAAAGALGGPTVCAC